MRRTLVAIGVAVALLAMALLTSVCRVPRKSTHKVAQFTIGGLRIALAGYHADHKAYPGGKPSDLFVDQAADLYTALVVTGKNAPYIDPDFAASGVDAEGRTVLLDPWDNPYRCRFWAPRQSDTPWSLDARRRNPACPDRADVVQHEVIDISHDPDGFDIWSDGPNGINEYGAPCSDDITSWDKEDDWANTCTGCLHASPAQLIARARPASLALVGITLVVGSMTLVALLAFGASRLERRWLRMWRRWRRRLPARRSPRPPQLHPPRPYAAHVRCVWCHSADREPMAACTSCSTLLHPDCWTRMRRCPTLGCGHAAKSRSAPIVVRILASHDP